MKENITPLLLFLILDIFLFIKIIKLYKWIITRL